MNIQIPKDIYNNPEFSIEQAGEMFDTLFLDPSKKEIVAKLCSSLPEFAREQNVNIAINTARGGLNELKNTIT